MHLELHPDVLAEFVEAAEWFRLGDERRGAAFRAAVDTVFARLAEFPDSGNPLPGGFRRALLRDFDYQIVYRRERRRVFVLAIAHLSRDPGYWRSRS